ncbi:MAG TPA: hypothetical protein EYQ21_02860 [Flavobacteriales bacterium]|nr:hypothetical protein [Flavobacteriales bacterium]
MKDFIHDHFDEIYDFIPTVLISATLVLLLSNCSSTLLFEQEEEFCYKRGYDARWVDKGWTLACVTPTGVQTASKIKYDEERIELWSEIK